LRKWGNSPSVLKGKIMSNDSNTASEPSPQERRRGFTRLILGLTLILIGVAYSLDRLGYLEAERLWDYAPLALVAAGLGKMFHPGSSSGRFIGFLLALVGAWTLAENLGWVESTIWAWWPVLFLLIGLRLVFARVGPVERTAGDTVNALAILGGVTRTSNSPSFRGGDLLAFMGGCEIDLRSAAISGGTAVIDAFALWGGIDIRVPHHWTVEVRGIPLLGGYEDSTEPEPASAEPAERPRLVVKGFAIMGGVDVRN
jgi:hypothetical protein